MNDLRRVFIAHFVIELWLDTEDSNVFESFFNQLIKELGLNSVSSNKYEFDNGGLTKVDILTTSHIALHTWPENHYAHIDLLTCTIGVEKCKIERALLEISNKTKLSLKKYNISKINYESSD